MGQGRHTLRSIRTERQMDRYSDSKLPCLTTLLGQKLTTQCRTEASLCEHKLRSPRVIISAIVGLVSMSNATSVLPQCRL